MPPKVIRKVRTECSFPGCGRGHKAHGLCNGHYNQYRMGRELVPLQSRVVGTTAERFWHYVRQEGSCWEWVGGKYPNGYGRLNVDGNMEYAHRVSYRIHKGEIPEGLEIRHQCHNRKCVNPDHLLVGTHTENMQDSVRDKKTAWGAAHGSVKLSADQVVDILDDERSQRVIAEEYGISQPTVSNIKTRRTWGHLEASV